MAASGPASDQSAPSAAPPVYALLLDEQNLAVEDALLDALPQLQSTDQQAAVDALIARGRGHGVGRLVGDFNKYDLTLQAIVLRGVDGLYAGARGAIDDEDPETRCGAVEFIRRSGESRLAYLLAAALCSGISDAKTREMAAQALQAMTADHLARGDSPEEGDDALAHRQAEGSYLARALLRAVQGWELHFRPEVLIAAMWLAERVGVELLELADQPRSNLGRAIAEQLQNLSDSRLAGFVWRALKSPVLRSDVARRIASCHDEEFMVGLSREAWLLADQQIDHACQRIRRLAWLEQGVSPTLADTTAGGGLASGVVRIVEACGLAPATKIAIYGQLLASGSEAVVWAVFWRLACDRTEAATGLLRSLVRQGEFSLTDLSAAATRELKRRGAATPPSAGVNEARDGSVTDVTGRFEDLWETFASGRVDETSAPALPAETLIRADPHFLIHLRAKLASSEPTDRVKALQLVRHLKIAAEVDTQVYRLASDPDERVRGTAVATLAGLDGPTTRRIVRRALEDPDARVQANAIELMAHLDLPQRAEQIIAKLDADHHRVRATAVASLLQMEFRRAADVLLDMLDDQASAHRIAALWVVERLQLSSLFSRLALLAEHDPDVQVRRRAGRILRALSTDYPVPDAALAVEKDL